MATKTSATTATTATTTTTTTTTTNNKDSRNKLPEWTHSKSNSMKALTNLPSNPPSLSVTSSKQISPTKGSKISESPSKGIFVSCGALSRTQKQTFIQTTITTHPCVLFSHSILGKNILERVFVQNNNFMEIIDSPEKPKITVNDALMKPKAMNENITKPFSVPRQAQWTSLSKSAGIFYEQISLFLIISLKNVHCTDFA